MPEHCYRKKGILKSIHTCTQIFTSWKQISMGTQATFHPPWKEPNGGILKTHHWVHSTLFSVLLWNTNLQARMKPNSWYSCKHKGVHLHMAEVSPQGLGTSQEQKPKITTSHLFHHHFPNQRSEFLFLHEKFLFAYSGFLCDLKHQDTPRKYSKQRKYWQKSCVDIAASKKVFIQRKQLGVSLLLPAWSKEYIRRMYLTHGNLDPWKSATKQRLQKMFIRKTGHYKRSKQIVQGTCSFQYNSENKKILQIQVIHPPELLPWAHHCSAHLPWKAAVGFFRQPASPWDVSHFLQKYRLCTEL